MNRRSLNRFDLWSGSRLEGRACGIPHLAKNERDVGHPAIGAGIEPHGLRQGEGYVDAT
jgi:hypothetical protein